MPIVVVTPPNGFPVSLEEAKKHLRAEEFTDDDEYIGSLIAAAVGNIDGPAGYLGRALLTQTLEWRGSGFGPCDVELAFPPVAEIISVKYDDENGDEQEMSEDDYRLVGQVSMPRLALSCGSSWPSVRQQSDAARVRFTAGYGDADDVPQVIKQAILLMIGHWYANRESVSLAQIPYEMPFAVRALLFPYQILA